MHRIVLPYTLSVFISQTARGGSVMIASSGQLLHLHIMQNIFRTSTLTGPLRKQSLKPYTSKFQVLQLGHSGAAVRQLQIDLSGLDVYRGRIDGHFGPETEKAMRRVQRNFGLQITGKCDAATWSVLAFGLGS